MPVRFVLCAAVALLLTASAAQSQPITPHPAVTSSPAAASVIRLNVQVTAKTGPVTDLSQPDFTLFDNKAQRPFTSFRVASRSREPVEAIVVFDAVNARFDTLAQERTQIESFLRANGGKLPIPFTIAILTDKGMQMMQGFSQDGNGLSQAIESNVPGLREITRAAGIWGAQERADTSLTSAQQLITYAARQPGRKLIFWVSPGWPILSGPGIQLDDRQENQIFQSIVNFSNAMREGDITLYSINPVGVAESLNREDYYASFLRGVSKPNQTDLGDLSVQVLALQSGGLTLSSTAVGSLIAKCLADSESWYEVSFEPAPGEHPKEYHHIEIKVNRPGVTVRTRDGYYAQP